MQVESVARLLSAARSSVSREKEAIYPGTLVMELESMRRDCIKIKFLSSGGKSVRRLS